MRIQIFVIIMLFLLGAENSFAQAKASQAVNLSSKTLVEKPSKPFWTSGTLMLEEQTYLWIKEAIKSNEQKIPLEIILPKLFPPPESKNAIAEEQKIIPEKTEVSIIPQAVKDIPEFYLKTILYFSPENWSIWLNDRKISNLDTGSADNIKIVSVSREQVAFLWEKKISVIIPNWKERCTSIEDNKYTCSEKNIVIDTTTDNISFVLKPNQSLIPKTLEIIEGTSVNPLVSNTQSAAGGSGAGTNATASPSSSKPDNLISKSLDPVEAMKNVDTLRKILDENVKQLRQ